MGKRTDELTGSPDDFTSGEPEAVPSGTIAVGARPSGALGYEPANDDFAESESPADAADDDDDIAQTRTQIEQTRENMSQTIDAIQERLSPQHIAQQAKETVRDATIGKATTMVNNAGDSAKGLGTGFFETIRRNPVPAALAGFGIGWLLVSGRKSSTSDDYGYRPYDYNRDYGYNRGGTSGPSGTMQTAKQRAGDMMQGAQGTASDLADRAQGTAGQIGEQIQGAAGQVTSGAQNLASQAGDTMSQLGNQAQYGVQQAQSGFQQMLQENPLGVAAGALAIGLAVGLAIPETDKENEVFGPARDNLMQEAQQTVQDTAQKVQNVAQEAIGAATDTAKREADNQGLSQQ